MLKISYAGCLRLLPTISTQFTLDVRVAAQNRKKITKTPYFGGSRSSMLTFLRSSSPVLIKQHICAYLQRFLRATAECFVRLCHRLGICPSITLVICTKTVQARITKSSLWAAPRSLVYRDKISCHWVQGFPSNEGVKDGYPP